MATCYSNKTELIQRVKSDYRKAAEATGQPLPQSFRVCSWQGVGGFRGGEDGFCHFCPKDSFQNRAISMESSSFGTELSGHAAPNRSGYL